MAVMRSRHTADAKRLLALAAMLACASTVSGRTLNTISTPAPTPSPVVTRSAAAAESTTTTTQSTATAVSSVQDILYDDDFIHLGSLIRFADWGSHAWGVNSMTAGTRVQWDNNGPLSHIAWRLMPDPANQGVGPNNAVLMSTSLMHVVSRDGQLVWSRSPDGYVTLVDYAAALQGDLNSIRVRIMDKHGMASRVGAPLCRGYHYTKMRFEAGGEPTPSDSGLAWQGQSDASYAASRRQWWYGFEVQDVDWTNPNLKKRQ